MTSHFVKFLRPLVWLSLCIAFASPSRADETKAANDPAGEVIRIGVYDTRAIALAYAASRFNPVANKLEEMEAAKAAGDTERIKELETWGQKHQRQLHRQGFGRVPVDDLLEHVNDKIPGVIEKADVVAITARLDFANAKVEAVDVTDALVALYDPPKRTLEWIRQLKGKEPVDLDDLEHVGD